MGDPYVDGKVREALVAAKGSRALAQQLMMTWAAQDERLLLGMAQPFLKAIAAAAVEGAVRRGTAPPPVSAPARSGAPGRPQAPRGALTKEALARVLNRMGDDEPPAPGTAPARPAAADLIPAALRGRPAPSAAGGGGKPAARPMTAVTGPAAGRADGVTHEKAMLAIAKAFAVKKMG